MDVTSADNLIKIAIFSIFFLIYNKYFEVLYKTIKNSQGSSNLLQCLTSDSDQVCYLS